MTQFLERSPGNKSLMRLLALLGFILGGVISIWGMVLLTISVMAVINGKVDAVTTIGSIVMVVGGGLALAGGGEVTKMIQQRSEVKETITLEGATHEVVVEGSIGIGDSDSVGGGH